MKRRYKYLLLGGSIFIFFFGTLFFIYSSQYEELSYFLEELQEHIPEDGSGEVKFPGYRGYTAKFNFILKNRTDLPSIKNKRDKKELEGEEVYYFAYPLPRLQIDLFINRAKTQDFDGEEGNIDKNTPEDGFGLNYYQHPTRDREQILEFLTALSIFETQKALTLLQKNPKLIPFIITYEPISFLEMLAGEDKIFGKVWSEDAGGSNPYAFDLFISGETLYLAFRQLEHS